MSKTTTANDPYFIDSPQRVKDIQAAMGEQGIDVYLGSRLRTLSWVLDAFCPWRSYVVIPPKGVPTAFTFLIDAARVADDSWLDEEHILGYGPMGGQDQIAVELVSQDAKKTGATEDVLPRIKRIAYAHARGCRGHQPHQPHGTIAGDHVRIEVTLDAQYRTDK